MVSARSTFLYSFLNVNATSNRATRSPEKRIGSLCWRESGGGIDACACSVELSSVLPPEVGELARERLGGYRDESGYVRRAKTYGANAVADKGVQPRAKKVEDVLFIIDGDQGGEFARTATPEDGCAERILIV